ncbi:fatty-acid-CoA ligase FadD [Mycobacteroides abscessus subsp. abscessus]|nr:fatty-acid-CoA ligase FadD [Mycobacteroides abscessus subsp. abscessus]
MNPHADGISLDNFVDWLIEAGEPFGVVVDACDGVAGFDEPVDEVVQRDPIGMRVHRIVGVELLDGPEGGDGRRREIRR